MGSTPKRIGPGALVLVVGPSGAGKDTLLAGARSLLADRGDIAFPRRLVTRASDPELEDHDTLSVRQFTAMRERGEFALSWTAHGLGYAIPLEIDGMIVRGGGVVCNVSRAAICGARARYAAVRVVEVTAPAEIRAARLAARGREPQEEILRRLERVGQPLPADVETTVIDNSGTVSAGASALVTAILRATGN